MGTVTADDFYLRDHRGRGRRHHDGRSTSRCTDGSLLTGLETWKANARNKAHIDYGFHMAVTDASASAIKEMADMVDEGVTSFKVFMAFKVVHGRRPAASASAEAYGRNRWPGAGARRER